MSNRNVWLTVLLLLLLFSVFAEVVTVAANPVFPTSVIKIFSPQSKTYNSSAVSLSFTVSEFGGTTSFAINTTLITCYLDGAICWQFEAPEFDGGTFSQTYTLLLEGLSEGSHSVYVTKTAAFHMILTVYDEQVASRTVNFTVVPSNQAVMSQNCWECIADMSQIRTGLGVAQVGGKIYTIGGYNQLTSSFNDIQSNEMYDPQTNTWTTLSRIPNLSGQISATVCNDKIYCIGKYRYGAIYVASGDFWQQWAIPADRTQVCMATVDDVIYLIGGSNASGVTDLTEAYNTTSREWKTKAPLLRAVANYASAVLDDEIYIIGGTTSNGKPTGLVQIYNLTTDTWRHGSGLPNPLSGASAAVTSGVYAPKRIYVVGDASNYVYNPKNYTWGTAASPLEATNHAGIAVVDDVLYLFGGVTYHYFSAEKYFPLCYSTTPITTNMDPDKSTSSQDTFSTETSQPLMQSQPFMLVAGIVVAVSVIFALTLLLFRHNRSTAKNQISVT
jgi:hypothetical protein